MTFILETFAITVLASVHTSSEVVVLGRWRGRSVVKVSIQVSLNYKGCNRVPVTIGRDHIVDPKLLANFLNTKVKCVSFELLASEVRHDHSRQAHKTSRLVLLLVTPAVALLASLAIAIGVQGTWIGFEFKVSLDLFSNFH